LFYVIGITFSAENELSCRFSCFKAASTVLFSVLFNLLTNRLKKKGKVIFFMTLDLIEDFFAIHLTFN